MKAVGKMAVVAAAAAAALGLAAVMGKGASAQGTGEACDAAAARERSIVFVRSGQEDKVAAMTKPVFEAFEANGTLEEGFALMRWDGVKAEAAEHVEWVLAHAREMCSEAAAGFRPVNEHRGIQYETHDELTHAANGDGYFRLRGEVDVPPELLVALVMDAALLGEMDETVMYMNMVKTFADRRTSLAIWVAAPGFPFLWRDGLDVSSWTADADGTFWQVATSVPDEMAPFAFGSVRAVDRYWGYRLRPLDGGRRTEVVLVCQTVLNGWMPTPIVNYMVGQVLADYIRTLEATGLKLERAQRESMVAAIKAAAPKY